ncbi:MAG: LPP20 family lipoprotein [Bacteriovoracaceae bacterium]|jgi:hypothetical protein|nr:LPP20 family lipoprotein [Bacteriovoracaceae bacterium]
MKNNIYILIFIILFMACSSKDKKGYEYSRAQGIEVPKWVYSLSEVCEEQKYLCASAEGESFTQSDLNAKKSLASILEVEVNSNYQLKRFGLTSLESKGLEEKIDYKINETISVSLNGARIQDRFKKENSFFSYILIKKSDVKKILYPKIKSIDSKLMSLYRQNKKVYVNKLLALLKEREALLSQYVVVTSKTIPAPLSYDQIYRLKNKDLNKSMLKVIKLDNLPLGLAGQIEQELTDLGFQIVKHAAAKKVRIKFNSKSEYLKVKGFEKFTFVLEIQAYDLESKKIGHINIKKVGVGRSKKDAYLKVSNQILKDFRDNIGSLNI